MKTTYSLKEKPCSSKWNEHVCAGDGGGVSSFGNRCQRALAAHILAQDSRTMTGNFFIVEEVLAKAGVSDFSAYAVSPGSPLTTDLFLDWQKFANRSDTHLVQHRGSQRRGLAFVLLAQVLLKHFSRPCLGQVVDYFHAAWPLVMRQLRTAVLNEL